MKFGEIRKPLLIFCLSASVALHCGAVWVIHTHPLLLSREDTTILMKTAPTIITKDNAELLVEQMEKALEESLNKVIAVAHFTKPNQPIVQEEPLEPQSPVNTPIVDIPQESEEDAPAIAPEPTQFAASLPQVFDPIVDEHLADFALDTTLEETPKLDTVTSPILSEVTLPNEVSMAQTTNDDYTMTDQQFSPDALPSSQLDGLVHSLTGLKVATKEQTVTEERMFTELQECTTPQLILPNAVDSLRSQWIKRSMAEISLPDLDYYGFDKVAANLKWQEDLDVEVTFMPDPKSNKYIFSLSIDPEFEETSEGMRQNFYFVIDRSVEKHKLSRFKMAVQRSLAALCEGDSFNIYYFDKYITKLSEKNLAVTPRTIQMAEEFLEFDNKAAKESFRSLEALLPTNFEPTELHSIILITDGSSLHTPQKQKKLLNQLAERGSRNINFYTAAAGKGNNLVLLDLLGYASAGKLLYSDTNAGFPRKMVQLIKNLHNPIVKDLTIEISPTASNAKIDLHPHGGFLPPMFAGQPYVLTGTVDELCDFTLFIQGKNRDKHINVRKRISLKEAPTGGRTLEKLWADTQAKICYEHFLENGKALYLKEAEYIVAPFHGDIASDQ